LEDGFLPHPNERVRERIFGDSSRLDVLLTDRSNLPVIVECKQGSPTIDYLKQIRKYMERLKEETGIAPRGILVHGGARKLPPAVAAAARKKPSVEIVQYSLDVEFARSD
jgi:RecB family endonuclease NucS